MIEEQMRMYLDYLTEIRYLEETGLIKREDAINKVKMITDKIDILLDLN